MIHEDHEYIENHAEDLMKNYLVKTIPHIVNKSIYQIDLANREVIKILKADQTPRKEKISAALAVTKTARDKVEIIAGNRGIVDKALELDQSYLKEEAEAKAKVKAREGLGRSVYRKTYPLTL